ncbi:damage-inducible protein DinB [Formosimonas limnophila]|uniref:Damage-inducible protein DinB n=1 Tax=Formosimonas limnophila TaxID=1384487 RepID=A0A8J3CP45_9BURK|nr:DinB family protein [Formosimonas limnophila]GHA78947.1 damage-inducible protein DinB [Formosimonas limnophila]
MTANLAKTPAQYNRWMNRRLYETCRELTDEQLSEDCGAYFKSIIGTLNHLSIDDSVWMARFTNQSSPYQQLNAIIYSDFTTLKMARERLDEEIVLWADSVTLERLQTTLHYTSVVNPQPKTLNMDIAVTHFFNHQTHHRGQVTTLLSQRGIDMGATDLPWMPTDSL